MPITRAAFGEYAFGDGPAEHTVRANLFLICGFMTYFTAGMTWMMSWDYTRRGATIKAFGQL
eukprot:CAMPEP_0173398724 /NCGR_PEP_ID=MMETSP1356-20130122/42760_1 /TAXON_ID=77927 ORGANISM="Hemiselmis virescens, Strain PCC157" /NCGR_SAMPLE_ID=MMETSP1356 /ASSEMBLY_ACC=CAM_ASM_000847 /LENGTH=61 /DNA_ID=CAMNT_0014358301 /DNA_START=40 /DNA_END=222 /DNA_ORIENTATION=+